MKAQNTRSVAVGITTLATLLLISLAFAEPMPEKAPVSHPPSDEIESVPSELAEVEAADELVADPVVSEVVFRTARLAANERGLRSRSRPRTIDATLIAETLERNATVNGTDIIGWLDTHHQRHIRQTRTDPRRWVAFLSASLERPEGWSERHIPWLTDDRGQAAWGRLLAEVQTWEDRGRPRACPAASPWTWGGSGLPGDRENLISMLESGQNRIVAGPTFADEPPGSRRADEQCEVDGITLASNVFLAKTRELDRGAR